jgi:hypothetical protein
MTTQSIVLTEEARVEAWSQVLALVSPGPQWKVLSEMEEAYEKEHLQTFSDAWPGHSLSSFINSDSLAIFETSSQVQPDGRTKWLVRRTQPKPHAADTVQKKTNAGGDSHAPLMRTLRDLLPQDGKWVASTQLGVFYANTHRSMTFFKVTRLKMRDFLERYPNVFEVAQDPLRAALYQVRLADAWSNVDP